jgi:hypothetical protein
MISWSSLCFLSLGLLPVSLYRSKVEDSRDPYRVKGGPVCYGQSVQVQKYKQYIYTKTYQ